MNFLLEEVQRKEKERLIDAEKQELPNKDDVVLSGEDKNFSPIS